MTGRHAYAGDAPAGPYLDLEPNGDLIDPRGPALYAASSIATPDEAIAFLDAQRRSGSTAWDNLCEKLQRTAYALPAHYSSAEVHARAIPLAHRYGHEPPSRGDLVLYLNGRYGHIVTCTGRGWECLTNDYTGRGRVGYADARDLVSWCKASEWFVADAWWSTSNYRRTHNPPAPPKPPAPKPKPKDDDMALLLENASTGAVALLSGALFTVLVDERTPRKLEEAGVRRSVIPAQDWNRLNAEAE